MLCWNSPRRRPASYYVEAAGYADQATGGYALSAIAGDIPPDASTDVSLSASGDYREGVLSPGGDRDWYRLDLAAGQPLRIALNNTETPDASGRSLHRLVRPGRRRSGARR